MKIEREKRKAKVIKTWGKMALSLDEDNKETMQLAIIEADAAAMLVAADMYIELRDVVSPVSQMYEYLTKASEVYTNKAQELLDTLDKKLFGSIVNAASA